MQLATSVNLSTEFPTATLALCRDNTFIPTLAWSVASLLEATYVLAVVYEGADMHYVRLLKDKTCTLGGMRMRDRGGDTRGDQARGGAVDLRSRH
jgi:hypothetical protein